MSRLTSQRELAAFHAARAFMYRTTARLLEGNHLHGTELRRLEQALRHLEHPEPWRLFLNAGQPPSVEHPQKWPSEVRAMAHGLAEAAHNVAMALAHDAYQEAAQHNAAQLELLSRDIHPTVITDVLQLNGPDRLLLEALLWLVAHDRDLLGAPGR